MYLIKHISKRPVSNNILAQIKQDKLKEALQLNYTMTKKEIGENPSQWFNAMGRLTEEEMLKLKDNDLQKYSRLWDKYEETFLVLE